MLRTPRSTPALLALLTPLLVPLAVGSALAQDDPRPGPRGGRTVYVPIDEFDEMFDREGGGVFVPYHELLELLERANGGTTPTPTPTPDVRPPTDYVLVGASFTGVAGERVVQFEATFDIEVLEEDEWVIVPIGLGQASLQEVVTSAGQRAVVGPLSELRARMNQPQPPGAGANQGYGIVLHGAGRVQTTARFALPVASPQPGESTFRVELPSAALCRFEVTLPQAGVRVTVDGALATESVSDETADQTLVRSYFGAGTQATVTWNPRPRAVEPGETREAALFARTATALQVEEGVVKSTTHLRYEIHHAPVGEFRIRFPADFRLLPIEVADPSNLVEDPLPVVDGEWKEITVRLHHAVEGSYELWLQLERDVPEGDQDVAFPRVETIGTEREEGKLAARASRYLRLERGESRGVRQIDVGELAADDFPQRLRGLLEWNPRQGRRGNEAEAQPPLVFKYLRQPWSLTLKSTVIEPEVDGRVLTLATIRDDEIGFHTTIQYTIRKRGIFGVRLRIPAGLRDLEFPYDGARWIKDHRVEEATAEELEAGLGDLLIVDFREQVPADTPQPFALVISGAIDRQTTGEDPTEDALGLPRFRLVDVKQETGVMGVAASQHLKLSKESVAALSPVGTEQLSDRGLLQRAGEGEEMIFGFTYSRSDDVEAVFSVSKREPQISCEVEMLVDAQEDQVRVEAALQYDVKFAGVDEVRIRVPAALGSATELKIEGDKVKERRVAPDPDDEDFVVWTVGLDGKPLGRFTVELSYDLKLDDFAAGEQARVTLHELQTLDCFSETGFLALKRHENLVIDDSDRDMIERRDKSELPVRLASSGALQAYRYVSHPHRFTLQITKYDFQAPLGILINHLHLDEVLGEDGKLQVEATLSLQNNAQQYLTVLLPPGSKFLGLKVDGRTEEWSESAEVEGRPAIQIHLGEITKSQREEPFQVRLRYDIQREELGSSDRVTFEVPTFPLAAEQQVPVARLTRSLFLPEGLAYLEFDTDAAKHFEETSLWETVKQSLGVRTGRERRSTHAAARQAQKAVADLKAMAPGAASGLYPALELPRETEPYLFEKLDSPTRLEVSSMAWPLFYFLDVLILLIVVGLGVFIDRQGLARASVAYVAAGAALMLLGGTFAGKSVEPYFASGMVGVLGLGTFFLGRGLWRELTVVRHQRRLEELAEQAQVAKARAQAAEAEARLRATAPVAAGVAVSAAPVDPKAAPADDAPADAGEVLEGVDMEDVDGPSDGPSDGAGDGASDGSTSEGQG
jgi:hypothetical protein